MTLTLKFHKYLLIILFIILFPILSFADEFEILFVKGVVELSTDQKNWQKASPPQKINSGTWIRTGLLLLLLLFCLINPDKNC